MNDSLEARRRRLLYLSRHTGTKETDLLLGGFAERWLGSFTATQLAQYEALLRANDDLRLLAWASGREPVPPLLDNAVMALLKDFSKTI